MTIVERGVDELEEGEGVISGIVDVVIVVPAEEVKVGVGMLEIDTLVEVKLKVLVISEMYDEK